MVLHHSLLYFEFQNQKTNISCIAITLNINLDIIRTPSKNKNNSFHFKDQNYCDLSPDMSEGDNLHCITSETGADRSDYGDNSTIYAAGFPGTVSRLSLLWLVDCSSKSDALLSDVLIQLSTS